MAKNKNIKVKSKTRILDDLKSLAETLNLSSVQVILLFACNEGFLNLHFTAYASNILEKIASDRDIQLHEDEPYFRQLLRHGVIPPELGIIFGFTKPKETSRPITEESASAVPTGGTNGAATAPQ